MQIFLNNEPLNVTIEHETTLGEVYSSLDSWLTGGGMQLIELSVDGMVHQPHESASWASKELADISRLDVTAGNENGFLAHQIMTSVDYLNLLLEILSRYSRGENLVSELESAMIEYSHLRNALPHLLTLSEEDFAGDFAALDQSAEVLLAAGQPTIENLREFHGRLQQLKTLLIDRIQELNNPVQELTAISALLSGLLPGLEEAGISLQTGNEKSAYNLVLRISGLTAKLVRIIHILAIEAEQIRTSGLDSKVLDLGAVIEEINRSMSDEDTVLLADLLEYDLKEKLEDILEVIHQLDPGEL